MPFGIKHTKTYIRLMQKQRLESRALSLSCSFGFWHELAYAFWQNDLQKYIRLMQKLA